MRFSFQRKKERMRTITQFLSFSSHKIMHFVYLISLISWFSLLNVCKCADDIKWNDKWNDIKIKEGVIRDIIYPKSGSSSSSKTSTNSHNDDYDNTEYTYGPNILLTLGNTCFNATYIPEDMKQTGNGRAR